MFESLAMIFLETEPVLMILNQNRTYPATKKGLDSTQVPFIYSNIVEIFSAGCPWVQGWEAAVPAQDDSGYQLQAGAPGSYH